ncbi:MAG: hypothetical protein R3250_09380 [Melioribacteraceae bacterium]|nr:hypothetical protein [Melioribacteraceae bacterium]
MSSFSCPHLDIEKVYCVKLKTDCIPGRKGCVISTKFQFAIPAEERIRKNNERKTNSKFEDNK